MQIRAQLRRNALAFAQHTTEYPECCWYSRCPSGYHGAHSRIRFKARPKNNGNKTGKSAGGQGK